MPVATYLATFLIIREQKLFEIIDDDYAGDDGLLSFMHSSGPFNALNIEDAEGQVRKMLENCQEVYRTDPDTREYLVIPAELYSGAGLAKRYPLNEEIKMKIHLMNSSLSLVG